MGKLLYILSGIKDLMIQLLFPRRCPVCDDIVKPFGEYICPKCVKKLKVIDSGWCMKCGKKLKLDGGICKRCRSTDFSFDRGRQLYEYTSVALSIYRFKYGGRQEYARFYGREIALHLADFINFAKPDAFIPVPLHHRRFSQRGYNQATLISKALSSYTGIPTLTNVLKRVKATKPMKILSPESRRLNIKKAFIIRGNSVKLESTIVIDDIYTTGATIDEVSRTLKQAGVKHVYFITLAGGEGI